VSIIFKPAESICNLPSKEEPELVTVPINATM